VTSPLMAAPSVASMQSVMNPNAQTVDTPDALAEQQAELDRIAHETATDEYAKALAAIYGDDFPLIEMVGGNDDGAVDGKNWQRWMERTWTLHTPGSLNSIYVSERNRLFRNGSQYLSRNGNSGQYKEPAQPKDAVRIIDNLIRPGLAWALQVMTEQRPGFRFTPFSNDPERQRYAEAKQAAVEYLYDEGKMAGKFKEAAYWAQTDGCSFLLSYWNPNAGPREAITPGEPLAPLGDPDAQVYRIEQVRVSADASATRRPTYWILRDVIPKQQGVGIYGAQVADEGDASVLSYQASQYGTINQYQYQPLMQNVPVVARYIVFCDRNEYLPNGLMAVIVGSKLVVPPRPLPTRGVPVIRITDGSEDPAFLPRPNCNELIQPQMRVNMLLSKLYESIRVGAGGRFISKSGALVTETLIGGQASVIEVRGGGPISDTIQPVQGFSVGEDTKFALSYERKAIEDRDGWNDTARGQFTSDQSGRAILAIREQLERTFAPFVMAQATSASEWADLAVEWMQFGYTVPRMVGVTGKSRSDLAMQIDSASLAGTDRCYVDPETMMPMPRPLRLWLLQDALEKGVIDKNEYRRRMPFAFTDSFSTPDDTQEAKARRIVQQILAGQPPEPTIWQDNEAIQQDILERDILLMPDATPVAPGQPNPIRDAANQRWQALAQQHQQKSAPPKVDPNSPEGAYAKLVNDTTALVQKQLESVVAKAVAALELGQPDPTAPPNPTAPVPGSVPGPNAGPGSPAKQKTGHPHDGRSAVHKGLQIDPRDAPLLNSSPPIAAGPLSAAPGSGSNQEMASQVFEHTASQ
jgi:hypothetical protein